MTKEKVIDILKGIKDGTACLMSNMPEDGEKAIDIAVKAVEQFEPHWIPVTERLPKIGNDVLTCNRYDDVEIFSLETDGYGMLYWEDGWEDTEALNDITAWMPLPEPFKEVTT